jgi:hypothetical protein
MICFDNDRPINQVWTKLWLPTAGFFPGSLMRPNVWQRRSACQGRHVGGVRHATSMAPIQQQCNWDMLGWYADVMAVEMPVEWFACASCPLSQSARSINHHKPMHWAVVISWLWLAATLHISLFNGLDVGPLIPVHPTVSNSQKCHWKSGYWPAGFAAENMTFQTKLLE